MSLGNKGTPSFAKPKVESSGASSSKKLDRTLLDRFRNRAVTLALCLTSVFSMASPVAMAGVHTAQGLGKAEIVRVDKGVENKASFQDQGTYVLGSKKGTVDGFHVADSLNVPTSNALPKEGLSLGDIGPGFHSSAPKSIESAGDYLLSETVKGSEATQSESTQQLGQEDSKDLFGYSIDTKYLKVGGSPGYSKGKIKGKFKADFVRFHAEKTWKTPSGADVVRGISTRLGYRAEAKVAPEDINFQKMDFDKVEFRSHADLEIGVEQRYHHDLKDGVKFSHRYFAGGHYRQRFGQESGSEVKGVVRAEQIMTKENAFSMFGKSMGWEAGAVQHFEVNSGRLNGKDNGSMASAEVRGLVTTDISFKALGKTRKVDLKVGPKVNYSTRGGFKLSPEIGVKVDF